MNENNLDLIPRIKELYDSGGNIIQFLRSKANRKNNTIQDILISYDFQSGSYIDYANNNPNYINSYTSALSTVINGLGEFNSILEVGVGEATTLANLIPKITNHDKVNFAGFDLSWSRISMAKKYIAERKESKADLFVSNLFNIALKDSSIDIVYTAHSLEPNGGREKEALKELYRVANRYLVLLEPTEEFASAEGKERMKKNGYVSNLLDACKDLRYEVVEFRRFDISANELNPTGLYIIKKNSLRDKFENKISYQCPISGTSLDEFNDHFYSKESLISYPKIMGIPCLCDFYGILTSKHDEEI